MRPSPIRASSLRLAPPLLALLIAACSAADSPPASGTDTGADTGASAEAAAAEPSPFVPGMDPEDPAMAALDRFLALSVEGAEGDGAELAALADCASDGEPYLPIERLATYEITGRTSRGDTTIVRARVVTVAEQNVSPTDPLRFVARQRVRRGEWEWDVVRAGDGWRVCNGPRFGVHAPDELTTWQPESASSATARALADSIRRVGRP
jgi:hypothetical protein